jgi:hypothetical protein
MRYLIGLLALTLTAMLSGSSLACGVCVEDKVAATYDHAVVTRAGAVHYLVVFGEIDGAVNIKAVTAGISAAAKRVRGIDRGTVRTSTFPPAFSFALDPAVQAPDTAVAELQKRLRTQGVKLSVLRVMSSDTRAARN